jgi:molybdopterin converting factor subunit 1
MHVRVRLFADLREAVGASELSLELEAGATAGDAWSALVARHPLLGPRRDNLATAVNRRYVRSDQRLADGDELVFVPPVSGG